MAAGGAAASSMFLSGSDRTSAQEPPGRNGIPTRALGRMGFQATVIGLGGQTVNVNARTVEEGVRFTRSILDEGVNYVDVSPSYGDAEAKIGPVMKSRRDEVFLACKSLERSKEGVARQLRESLRTLQTDYFDLYQFHALDSMEDADEALGESGALAALLEAREKGLIRYIGVTSHRTEVLARMLNAFDFDSIMVAVNPFDRFVNRAEAGVIQQARAKNVAIIGIKPWLSAADVPDTETALRYALSRPISVLLPRHMAGCVEEAIKVARAYQGFGEEEEEQLLAWYGSRLCRQCNYCTPCPRGIDIPLVFRLEGYRDRWAWNEPFPKRDYAALPVKADTCDDCGECEKRCPFQIPIVQWLKEIHRKLAS